MDGNSSTATSKSRRPWRDCRFLLACLVAMLVAFPFLEDVASPLALVIPLAGVLVAGVIVTDSEPVHVRRAIVIAAVQVSLTAASLVLRQAHAASWIALVLALAALSVLILYSAYCVLRYILRARTITRDQIYAGICMYVMLGFAFGAVFYLVNGLDPESFIVNQELAARGSNPDLMYFSFVTLATLGYGDITPRTNIARSLAILEALTGMLYIAIFMARLVSLRATNETDPVV